MGIHMNHNYLYLEKYRKINNVIRYMDVPKPHPKKF